MPIDAPMRFVVRAEDSFLNAAVDVGRAVTDRRGQPIRWLLAHASTNGVIQLRVRPVPDDDAVMPSQMGSVVNALVGGFATIEREPTRPDFFSDNALERAEELGALAGDLGAFRVTNGAVSTEVTEGTARHVRELLGPAYHAYGSIDGYIERVNLHDRKTFTVYDALTDRPTRCEFGNRVPVERIANALAHQTRVEVYGSINYRSDDHIESMLVDTLYEFPPADRLPSADDVRGILGRG